MILIYRLLAIALRIFLVFSPICKQLSKFLMYDSIVYSKEILKENIIINNFVNNHNAQMINSDNYFSSILTQNFFYFIHNNNLFALLFFALMDVSIGIIISRIGRKKENSNGNNYLEIIYLFNPISLLNCANLRLDIFYTFLNLMFICQINNFWGSFFLMLSVVTSPGYIFINFFSLLYYFINKEIKDKSKFVVNLISSLLILAIIMNFTKINLYKEFVSNFNLMDFLNLLQNSSLNFFEDIKLIYYNYYFVKETLPNMGMFWSLLPQTFLKFQNFSYWMLLNYQIILNIAIVCLINRLANLPYKNRNSFLFTLLFILNHTIDRYPCENHYVICLILISQHSEIVIEKIKILNLSMLATLAGYTLMFSRGYHYRMKRTGTSNFLFFQNLTYSISMVLMLLFMIYSTSVFIKKHRRINKIKEIIYVMINKAIKK